MPKNNLTEPKVNFRSWFLLDRALHEGKSVGRFIPREKIWRRKDGIDENRGRRQAKNGRTFGHQNSDNSSTSNLRKSLTGINLKLEFLSLNLESFFLIPYFKLISCTNQLKLWLQMITWIIWVTGSIDQKMLTKILQTEDHLNDSQVSKNKHW